jgi:hypothetical protein
LVGTVGVKEEDGGGEEEDKKKKDGEEDGKVENDLRYFSKGEKIKDGNHYLKSLINSGIFVLETYHGERAVYIKMEIIKEHIKVDSPRKIFRESVLISHLHVLKNPFHRFSR